MIYERFILNIPVFTKQMLVFEMRLIYGRGDQGFGRGGQGFGRGGQGFGRGDQGFSYI
ncbi:hypothetical protein HanPSC8_Chr08g0313591 [Helianthus annuus]|nr:hypothetical protein HanPSC8_Chr08g0313591 [Helianthus annuus]